MVKLSDLVKGGVVQVGDEVTFVYMKIAYSATIGAAGELVCARHRLHTRASRHTTEWSYYVYPTTWTNDCIAAAGRDGLVKTNPSGWDRVIVKRTGTPLSALRDQYAKTVGCVPARKSTKRSRIHVSEESQSTLSEVLSTLDTRSYSEAAAILSQANVRLNGQLRSIRRLLGEYRKTGNSVLLDDIATLATPSETVVEQAKRPSVRVPISSPTLPPATKHINDVVKTVF